MAKTTTAIVATLGLMALATPAQANDWWSSYKTSKHCGCTSSSGGTTTSGGTEVPEPGMLGMFGAGLIGLGFARTRRRRKAK